MVKKIISIVTSLIVGAALLFGWVKLFPQFSPFGSTSKSTDSQVITAITRTEQVSLLSLGIQGVSSQENSSKVFGMNIPGSERARFIQYTFTAKLGIDGKDVTIEPNGDHSYTINIPDFIFIGYDNPEYRMIAENNGILSFGTKQPDTTEMINTILSDKAKQEYVDSNTDLLKDQAKSFYTSIIMSIDPEVQLNFTFASDAQSAESDDSAGDGDASNSSDTQ